MELEGKPAEQTTARPPTTRSQAAPHLVVLLGLEVQEILGGQPDLEGQANLVHLSKSGNPLEDPEGLENLSKGKG